MRSVFDNINKALCLGILSLLLVACGGGGGGGGGGGTSGGGFTQVEPIAQISVRAARNSLPVNLNGESPSLVLPYTTSVIVQVERNGLPITDGTSVQLAVDGVRHGGISTLDDPETSDINEFEQLLGQGTAETAAGQAQYFFTSFSEPGISTLTASVQDPDTGLTISATTVIGVTSVKRPVAQLAFAGAYVDAVQAGASRFGNPDLQNGAYTRQISVIATDASGNPVNPGTPINFFVIDAPITGYPNNGPGSFFIAGSNGNPTEGDFLFTAQDGNFSSKGAQILDRLVLDGTATDPPLPDNRFATGVRVIEAFLSNPDALLINLEGLPFNEGTNNGATVPYIIGRSQHTTILSPFFTNVNGVAETQLTYPVNRLGQTAILVACNENGTICTTLNTCDATGSNCGSVFLGVADGTDRILTASTQELGPNTTTDVTLCLQDANFSSLPATIIDYSIGSKGPATVTVDGNSASEGTLTTGGDGCVTTTIASSGQNPDSDDIPLTFTSDGILFPLQIDILSPGSANLDGISTCNFFDNGTARCTLDLRLTDENFTPLEGVIISLGDFSADGPFEVRFNPAAGDFGITDSQGLVTATVDLLGPGDYSFDFVTPGEGATFSLDVTVLAPQPFVLTTSTQQLAPNTTTDVVLCLQEADFAAVPNASINYSIGPRQPAQVTVNGSSADVGSLTTGSDGCALATISSNGQNPGSADIVLTFTADLVATPVEITILAPGDSSLEGIPSCNLNPGSAQCTIDLRLTDNNGAPIPGIVISLGTVSAAGTFDISFNPAAGDFGITNSQGQVTASLQLLGEGSYSFEFVTPGASASYTFDVTVPPVDSGGGQQSFSGQGNATVEFIQLQDGITVFRYTHDGEGTFSIELLDENGTPISILVNTTGEIQGETARNLEAGNYFLNIIADGNWTVVVEGPAPSPGPGDGMPEITAVIVNAETGNPISSISLTQPGRVEVIVTDADGDLVNAAVVTFKTDLATFNPSSGTALTDASGKASIELVAGNTLGADLVEATAVVDGESASTTVGYQVVAPNLQLGSGEPFMAGTIDIGTTPLSAGGTSAVSVTLVDENMEPVVTPPVSIAFTSPCVQSGDAALEAMVTTVNGIAANTYVAQGCLGADTITATADIGGQSLTAMGTIEVLPAALGSIQFVSTSSNLIALKGTGGAGLSEQATLTFKVVDTFGRPVANQQVDFSLNTTVGGINLTPTTALTNNDGQVQTTVNSGTVATSVRVTATIPGTNPPISTQSDQLVVTTGIPDQDSSSVSATVLNPEAFNFDGVEVGITILMADFFNNPVPDGTSATFTTEGASIQSACNTTNGGCTVNWVSQDPRPLDGRTTILVTAIGNESFTDVNGNGVYDDGEPFVDLPEAWRDDNENGVRDPNEIFVDFNENGVYDPADGLYNGILCAASNCGPSTLNVRDSIVLVMSGSGAQIVVTSPAVPIEVPVETSILVSFNVSDARSQPMPADTTIEVDSTYGSIEGTSEFTVPSTNVNSPLFYSVVFKAGDEAGNGFLSIKVTTPRGLVSERSFGVVGTTP